MRGKACKTGKPAFHADFPGGINGRSPVSLFYNHIVLASHEIGWPAIHSTFSRPVMAHHDPSGSGGSNLFPQDDRHHGSFLGHDLCAPASLEGTGAFRCVSWPVVHVACCDLSCRVGLSLWVRGNPDAGGRPEHGGLGFKRPGPRGRPIVG